MFSVYRVCVRYGEIYRSVTSKRSNPRRLIEKVLIIRVQRDQNLINLFSFDIQ